MYEVNNLDSSLRPRPVEVVGYHEAFEFGGDRLRDNTIRLVRQSPKIGGDVLSGMGNTLANTSLSYKDWAFATISTLIALGDCTDQLNVYVEGALKSGANVDEILDLINHSQQFVGHPRAVNALRAVWDTLSQARGVPLPETYTETLIRIGDHETNVRDTHGSGVPIILIHALSLDSGMYKDILPGLAQATGARVIAYDMRGHGHARGAPPVQGFPHLCADLEKLLDTLKIEKVDIYGASFGGAVSQYFALDYPHRVRSISPMGISAISTPAHAARAARAEQEHTVRPQVAESLIRWFLPETIAENAACVRYARRCIERCRVEDWAASWNTMSTLDTRARLHELKIPVMALSGTHDSSATPKHMHEIVDCCKSEDAEFVSIEDGSHMMFIESPEKVTKALISFREKVDARNHK